jgi:hypothetical protein
MSTNVPRGFADLPAHFKLDERSKVVAVHAQDELVTYICENIIRWISGPSASVPVLYLYTLTDPALQISLQRSDRPTTRLVAGKGKAWTKV